MRRRGLGIVHLDVCSTSSSSRLWEIGDIVKMVEEWEFEGGNGR
jgi:hypothetical protein